MEKRAPTPEEHYQFNERVAIMLESAGLPHDLHKADIPKEILDTAIQQNLDRLRVVPSADESGAGGCDHVGQHAGGPI